MHARVKQPMLNRYYFSQSKHRQGETEAVRPGWSRQHQTPIEKGIKSQDYDIVLLFMYTWEYHVTV